MCQCLATTSRTHPSACGLLPWPAPLADLAAILAVDWLLDRVRTCVNLLGDAYGCVMVDHLMQRRSRGRRQRQIGGLGGASAEGLGGGSGKQAMPYIQLEMGLREQLARQPQRT
jgi:hypothetical protein